ncbi:MAG: FAD-binding protein [Coriobacteriales bacterium]|nr:FAD-binding protein [Coriobacteriales bacterium]
MSQNITRRNLVKGTALAGAAAAINAMPVFAAEGEAFDDEYDVVVVGMGGAGMNAAVAAYEEGAKVLIVEKAPEDAIGGNTYYSGQAVLSTDDADAFNTYLVGLMGEYKNYDPECLRAYAEGAAGNWNWLVDVIGMNPEEACPTEYVKGMWGGESTWHWYDDAWGSGRGGLIAWWNEFPELEGSDHSYVIMMDSRAFNSKYYLTLKAAVDARLGENLTVWRGAPARKFILSEDGAVVGVVVEKDGELVKVGAKGGVCMCCGGFEANPTMAASFCQIPYMYARAGVGNDGDGIYMCQAIGAQLWHMSNLSGLGYGYHMPGTNSATSVSISRKGILVGPAGGRFVNEAASSRHGRIKQGGGWIIPPMPMPAFAVVDADQIASPLVSGFSDGNADEIADGTVYSGDTLEELAEKIRVRAPQFNLNGEFVDAVNNYNAHVDAEEVDDFGRKCTVPVKTPPFYAIEICPALSFNTQGGPRHSAKGEILDTHAMPIPGLFAGGEFGSIFPDMYNGGGNLGETCIFGRIAGRNAGLRAKGEFEPTTEPCKLQFELEMM